MESVAWLRLTLEDEPPTTLVVLSLCLTTFTDSGVYMKVCDAAHSLDMSSWGGSVIAWHEQHTGEPLCASRTLHT